MSVSAIIGDEAKFLNKQKLDNELMPVNRGGNEYYGDIAEHHSVTFTTDMPTTKDAKWVLGAKEECLKPHHQRAIELILAVQLELYKERQKLQTHLRNQARSARIATYEKQLNELRRGLVHYASASSFANVHSLGFGYFRQYKRTSSPKNWNAAFLNKEQDGVEHGFYPDFDNHIHQYDATDYRIIDPKIFANLPFEDCRKDEDIDKDQPLTIGMDYGSSFNCMVVGQRFSGFISRIPAVRIRYATSIVSLFGSRVCVRMWWLSLWAYYQYFYKKEVMYVYDPTAVGKNGFKPDGRMLMK